MDWFYRGIKNNSFWLIPLFSLICFVSLVLEYVFQFTGTDDDVFYTLGQFLSFLFPYAIALFLMVFGKLKGNIRMQNLIVLLAGIYLAVSNFKDGVSGIAIVVTSTAWIRVAQILTFFLSLCWCFILFEGSFGYLQGNSEKRLPVIAATSIIILVIQTVILFVNTAQVIITFGNPDLFSWSMILSGVVSWSFVFALFFTFVDIHYIGSNNYRIKKKKKEESMNDLDIHTY